MDFREGSYSERMKENLGFTPRRMVVLPWILWVVLIGLSIGGALYASRVEAAEVFRSTDDKGGAAVLTLHKQPCTNEKVLPHILPSFRSKFQRATLYYWGRDWASCWYDHEGTIISIDDQGAPFQPIPRRMFKDESV